MSAACQGLGSMAGGRRSYHSWRVSVLCAAPTCHMRFFGSLPDHLVYFLCRRFFLLFESRPVRVWDGAVCKELPERGSKLCTLRVC